MNTRPVDYVFGQMLTIEGYLDPCDALVYTALMQHQSDKGYAGGGAEIGIFYGRSYFLIKMLLETGQEALALDLFQRGEVVNGVRDQVRIIHQTAESLGLSIPEACLIEGSSLDKTGEDLKAIAGPIRFFSVDGGHQLRHVRHDAVVARDCLSPEGIIVFDDFYNYLWPEVSIAVLEFLEQNKDRYVPFAITPKKLYVCARNCQGDYMDLLVKSDLLKSFKRSITDFNGVGTVAIEHKLSQRLKFEAFRKLKLNGLGKGVYL